ncbi:ABC transporter ATP-binding protein [Halococcus salifodinae]|uniref:Molybdate/tungstate import ATP-binding protein WtpC n=1 Tax=Halococcus salifodinae DSM 8989 TaxID=1227456 RepID=M0NFR4_9EURY|nr:ABC transporter ATP-binding protein [Halococcus salifodinae]EMA55939.1 putative sulfonate ABC transporter ATP-binding protein [Halococcus salifodinae DSM 8989]
MARVDESADAIERVGAHANGTGDADDTDHTPEILVDGVSKRYESERQSVQALSNVQFTVESGEFVCLVGPSGCGKTTLLRAVAGIEAPTAGTVVIDGETVDGPDTDCGMVFQEYGLFPWLTVQENVCFGLERQGMAREACDNRCHEMLDLVGLDGVADAYPKELSGGMKQRVAVARALAVDPDVLLMDEPFGSVDARTRERLHAELLDIWQETGKTTLFVTHEVNEAALLGDRVVVMSPEPGRVKEIVDVDLSRPRSRTDGSFVEYTERIRALIGGEATDRF